MANYVHAEALNMSICKMSSENALDLSVIEALETAFAEEMDANVDTPRSDCGLHTKERTATEDTANTPSTMASDTPEDVLELLQLAQAEALEFEGEESGAEEERLHDLKNDVDKVQADVAAMQECSSEDDLPSRISSKWSLADCPSEAFQAKPQVFSRVVQESSPVIEALQEAIAESIEAFQRQASDEDEDHVISLELSLKESRNDLAKEGLPPRTPQCMFSEPGKCDSIAAVEEGEMEMLEAQAHDSSDDEEDREVSVNNIRASIAILKSCS